MLRRGSPLHLPMPHLPMLRLPRVRGLFRLGGLAATALAWGAAAQVPPGSLRACPRFGDGFWTVPGSETCIRIGGSARSDTYAHGANVQEERFDGDPFVIAGGATRRDRISLDGSASLSLGTRTATAYGTLRTSLEISTDGDDDRRRLTRGRARRAEQPVPELETASLEWRGVTAGLATSYFSFDHPVDAWGTHLPDFTAEQFLVGYSARLGKGVTAALALESGEIPDDDGLFDHVLLRGWRDARTIDDRRRQHPAAVGHVRWKGDWGSAQIAGALTGSRSMLTGGEGVARLAAARETLGSAVSAGLAIDLPRLSEDSAVVISASYSHGASFYTAGLGNVVWIGPREVRPVEVAGAFAGLTHAWTERLRSNAGISLSAVNFDLPGGRDRATGVTVTANLVWTPVRDLDLGIEFIHAWVDAGADAADLIDTTSRSRGASGVIFRVESKFGS